MITCSKTPSDGAEGAPPPAALRGRFSATGAFTRSYLNFDGKTDATLDRWATLVSSDLFAGRFDVTLAAGTFELGSLSTDEQTYDLDFGYIGSAGLSWRVLDDRGALPYVVLSASVGAAGVTTKLGSTRGQYLGIDFRFGATVGKTFAGWFSPYVSVRLFGGPILWTLPDGTHWGTDRYHFQGAAGAVFILPKHFDLFVEGEPGAEQGAFGGVGVSY